MAKWCSSAFMDAALTWLQNNTNKIVVTSATISAIAQATAATVLARTTLSTGSFVLADDVVLSGRKVTIAQQATIAVLTTGQAAAVAIYSSATVNATQSATGLFYMTTCATQILGSTANKVTIPAWSITIQDVT